MKKLKVLKLKMLMVTSLCFIFFTCVCSAYDPLEGLELDDEVTSSEGASQNVRSFPSARGFKKNSKKSGSYGNSNGIKTVNEWSTGNPNGNYSGNYKSIEISAPPLVREKKSERLRKQRQELEEEIKHDKQESVDILLERYRLNELRMRQKSDRQRNQRLNEILEDSLDKAYGGMGQGGSGMGAGGRGGYGNSQGGNGLGGYGNSQGANGLGGYGNSQGGTGSGVPMQQAAPAPVYVQPVAPAPAPAPVQAVASPVQTIQTKAPVNTGSGETDNSVTYFAATLGIADYPDAINVRGNVAAGVVLGTIFDEVLIAELNFLYGSYDVEEVFKGTVKGWPIMKTLDQYNFGGALKYRLPLGRMAPTLGGMISYSYRAYTDTQYYLNIDEETNSNSFDVGVVAGIDLDVSRRLTITGEYRYLWNVWHKISDSYEKSFVNSPQYTVGKPLEEFDHHVFLISGKIKF